MLLATTVCSGPQAWALNTFRKPDETACTMSAFWEPLHQGWNFALNLSTSSSPNRAKRAVSSLKVAWLCFCLPFRKIFGYYLSSNRMPCIIRGREVTNRWKTYCAPYCPFYAKNQAPSEARGVVIGGPKHVKSCEEALIDSKMAGLCETFSDWSGQ